MNTTIMGVSFLFAADDLLDWIKDNADEIEQLELADEAFTNYNIYMDGMDIRHEETATASASMTLDEAFHQWLTDEVDEDVPGDIQYDLCALERFIEEAPEWTEVSGRTRSRYLVTYKSRSQGMHDVEVRDKRLQVERRDGYTAGVQNALHSIKDCIEENSDSGGDQLAAIYNILNIAEIKLADPNEPDNKGGV